MSSQETFSITTLQRMCARSEYLDESDIHMNDKTVSWDGNIIYYKTKKPASTGNEFLIPIQVKGKEYNILPDSDSISYPVDINDLKNYLKNGGVIFFVDAISKTEYNDKMYAKILLPVDIVHIMKGKEEQGSITVHLNHVKTVRELEELCVLFKENRPKQAMVGVGKSIPDYDNISNFTISTLPTPYMNPAIAIAKSPFKYVYTKKDGMEIPVLLTDLVTATESEWLIKIDDKIEQRYPVRHIYELNQTTTRISVIQQLKQIEGFIENYEEYLRYKDNAIIRELKASPKRLYMALFYRQEIELLNKKESLIKELNKSKELLMNYSNNVWSVDETLFNKIKIKAEIIAQIKTLLLNQKKEQSQLDDADKVLAQMTKARRGLIKEFYNAAESGKFDKNKCPLCGTDFTDIDSAIIETERFIKNIHTDGIKIIEDIETQITNLFQKEIIPVLKVFLEENKVLIKMDDTLSGCKNLAVEKLQQLLDKVKISEFKSQGIEKFDIEEFSQQYENLLKELQEKEVPNKIIFQEKQVELYKSIHNTYYHNEKPYHTVGELQSKEQYVAKLFNDNLSQQLSTEEARLRKLKRDYEEYKNKTKDMTDAIKVLVGKYEDANKEYQTQLLNAIKIPLMVYSGRIIQNYPLGLGIRAVIKTNQLVFEAASKSGSDVYNILSTGQLNGLSIALLLSIKNVYGDTKGLDILLIDDPLQTIDDISAISLADLLTQQGIGQIVLSTHEEAKAALLRYKFKHAGMSVREQNMQALYMKTVTEE